MSRGPRIFLWIAGVAVGLVLVLGVAGVFVLRSVLFHDQLRDRVVAEMEKATGGKVEIRSVEVDWRSVTAYARGITVHGTEPASAPPFLHVDEMVLGLKIVSLMRRSVDLALLRVEKPQVLLLIAKDGTTNVPSPKTPKTSTKAPVETILDLAIQRFELNSGLVEVRAEGQKPSVTPYHARGENLRTAFTFDARGPRYHGDVEMHPVHVQYGQTGPVDADVSATLTVEKDRLVLEAGRLAAAGSELLVKGDVTHFAAPVTSVDYQAKVDLEKARSLLGMKALSQGAAEAHGRLRYASATDWSVSGPVKAVGVTVRSGTLRLSGLRAETQVTADPKHARLDDLKLWGLGGDFRGKAWSDDMERFAVKGDARGFEVGELAALATTTKIPWDAVVSGPLEVSGRLSTVARGDVLVSTKLGITPGRRGAPVHGLLDARYDGVHGTIDMGPSFVELPSTRLDVSGSLGQQMQVKLVSHDLNDLRPLVGTALPVALGSGGSVSFVGAATGKLSDPAIAGHLAGTGVVYQGQTVDSANVDVALTRSGLVLRGGSVRQQAVTASIAGSVGLRDWKLVDSAALDATVGLRNESVAQLAALAGQKALPVTGTVNIDAHVTGTVGNPLAKVDAVVTKGTAWGEPFDRATAHVEAPNKTTQTMTLALVSGKRRLDGSATYSHSATEAVPGRLEFKASTSDVELRSVGVIHERSPDLSGLTRVNAEGAMGVTHAGVQVVRLNADVTAKSVQVGGRALGDMDLSASTNQIGAGPTLDVKLRSSVAGASLVGDGQWTLAGDYPGNAKVTFTGLNLDVARRVLLSPAAAEKFRFGGGIEGTLTIAGPLKRPDELRAELEVPKFEIRQSPGAARATGLPDVALRNDGPVRLRLANNVVRVDSAKFKAQDTAFGVTGRVNLSTSDVDLRMEGTAELRILELVDSQIVSSGQVGLNAAVRGSLTQPQMTGQMTLKNANLALVDLPNGLSNANGTVLFNGDRATVQSFTAESGGGKVRASGFASLTNGNLTFRLTTEAAGVRVRYPEGVSTVADATLAWVGNSERSMLSGNVNVQRLAFNPRTDLGSLLSSASSPVQTPSGQTGLVSGMQFDVQIDTSPDITFQSGLTEGIEADASLKLRGNLSNPVLLGRMNITQGDLTFFGNKYVINQGSISFFNPVKLEPVLNIDLETRARGVDVTLTVSGPVNKLNVSYRSDPPLEFSDIVALLATGRAPQDATIAARQPTGQTQNWQQMGASALVGQAIANPVAGRLQRFFGVSKLKIDPMLSGVTGTPQAKVTIEQQVTPDITFTYITNVADTQQQVVRVEWAMSRNWSVVALRDSNGQFGMDFLYKKRFK